MLCSKQQQLGQGLHCQQERLLLLLQVGTLPLVAALQLHMRLVSCHLSQQSQQ